MAGCARAPTVAYQASGKASYLFGDIDPEADVEALVAFAARYADSPDGWTRATDRPKALLHKTLARIPGFPLQAENERGARS